MSFFSCMQHFYVSSLYCPTNSHPLIDTTIYMDIFFGSSRACPPVPWPPLPPGPPPEAAEAAAAASDLPALSLLSTSSPARPPPPAPWWTTGRTGATRPQHPRRPPRPHPQLPPPPPAESLRLRRSTGSPKGQVRISLHPSHFFIKVLKMNLLYV